MNLGTDYTSAGCDWGKEGTLRVAGFAFSLAEASRALSRASLAPHRMLELEG